MEEKFPNSRSNNNFTELYPKGRYKDILLEEIPGELQEKLEKQAFLNSLKTDKSKPVNFFVISLDDGSSIFGARYDDEIPVLRIEKGETEEMPHIQEPAFYIYELNDHGDEMGQGGVKFKADSKIPSISYVESYEKGLGIGTERYYLLSALSRKFFGQNLYSDVNRSPEAEKIWKKFVKEGKAVIADDYIDPATQKRKVRRYKLLYPA